MMRKLLWLHTPFSPQALASNFGRHKPRRQFQDQHQRNNNNNNNTINTKRDENNIIANMTKSLWCCEAEEVAVHDIKRTYANDRFLDKKTRFIVRQRVREDGVVSNFFLLQMSPETTLYSYEIEATCRLFHKNPSDITSQDEVKNHHYHNKNNHNNNNNNKNSNGRGGKTGSRQKKNNINNDVVVKKRVDSTRAWRVIQRFLHKCIPNAPPLVNVRQKVYSISPLPANALELPPEYLDMGWEGCKLRFIGKVQMIQMAPMDIQEITNKIVLWTLRQQGQKDINFSVAKETNGKLVYTHDCFVVGGLRVFKGTVVRAVFIDDSNAMEGNIQLPNHNSFKTIQSPPSSSIISTLSAGNHTNKPLKFLVKEYVREFEYKDTIVQSYRVEDASGITLASLWKATPEAKLNVGEVYEVTNYRVRVFENRDGMRLLEFTVGETSFNIINAQKQEEQKVENKENIITETSKKRRRKGSKRNTEKEDDEQEEEENEKNNNLKIMPDVTKEGSLPSLPGKLVLKIDTKSTVAADISLWEEIKQHFGSGPYDSETEERIARSVQGTPVITSVTLRHSLIRLVRFNIIPTALDLEPALQRCLKDLEPGQPYAVLTDYSVIPMQALHCCYDPRMKSWQDITVSACSFLPSRRIGILEMFRTALVDGMQHWGLTLATQPYSSKALSLLPAPQKVFSPSSSTQNNYNNSNNKQQSKNILRHPSPPSFPTTIAVIAIAPAHVDTEERGRFTQTAQAIAKSLRTTIIITVPDEKSAVQFIVEQLTTKNNNNNNNSVRTLLDPNTAAIIVSRERETRPARWVHAECLSRGILAVFMPPAASPKRQNLLAENVRLRLRNVFETNPLRGVDLPREVPAVGQRRVLIIGIDACHTSTFSTGSIVGILCAPERNHLIPFFWKHETRGEEVGQVSAHFELLLQKAINYYDGLDEVVVFQDGDVRSEMLQMQAHIPAGCGFTFMCLHKRTNVRFIHQSKQQEEQQNTREQNGKNAKTQIGNVVKGVIIQALTPVSLHDDTILPSFYLQSHDCNMSTARTVHYTVHSTSPTLEISDVQHLSYVLSHVLATQATKLPMATRCAHRLASISERLLDAAPPLKFEMIPAPLNERLWFF